MDAKIVVLVVVSVFAFSSVSTLAEVPAYCYQKPQPKFSDEIGEQKWGFLHEKNKCVKYEWNGDISVRNYFNSERECMDTCSSKESKNYILRQGVCVCRCPKCNHNDDKSPKAAVKRETTPELPNISESFSPILEALQNGFDML